MTQKKKSRRPSAKARRHSNSKDAPSGNSVRKKSGKSKEKLEGLRVRTPNDSKLAFLDEAGVIVPEEIPSDEDNVPLDFTRLSNRGIGHLQSRYAVRHAHAIFNAAKVGADAAALKRELRLEKAKFRLHHKKEKVNVVAAMMEDDDEISELEDKLLEVEAKEDLLQAVAQGYADLRDAASREITRRMGERAAVD
jgi:hypothetical protein